MNWHWRPKGTAQNKNGGAPGGGGGAPAATVPIGDGGGSHVSTDQCNASLLSDVLAYQQIHDHEAFAGVDLATTSSLGAGLANREPFEEAKCAQAFSADTKT